MSNYERRALREHAEHHYGETHFRRMTMHDYKHRPARRAPDWFKITIGLALTLPFLWLWAAVMLSF